MKIYLKSYDGIATGSITEHKDGTATLSVTCKGFCSVTRHKSEHKNVKASRAAWYRWNA